MNSKVVALYVSYTVATIDVTKRICEWVLGRGNLHGDAQVLKKDDYICKMKKSLYGQQAANVWFEELVKVLLDKMSYKQLVFG